jgi:transcriptional regulator with PAS, ATPase and Fis domain
VIAATNRDLRAEVETTRFRGDLFYRLGIIELRLPPLRERREDIPLLAAAFIREFADRFNRSITGLTQAAERVLQNADWPGNIRELRNVLERASLQTSGGMLTERELSAALAGRTAVQAARPETAVESERDPDLLSTAQRDQIRRVLVDVDGNKAAAAKLLGISRRSRYRWLERLDLDV